MQKDKKIAMLKYEFANFCLPDFFMTQVRFPAYCKKLYLPDWRRNKIIVFATFLK